MTLKQGMDNGIVFYRDTSLENMLKEVFSEEEEVAQYIPTDIRMFTKEDYEEYEKEGCVYPNGVSNPKMFIFTARNGNVYLGCFNGDCML